MKCIDTLYANRSYCKGMNFALNPLVRLSLFEVCG